ncbi:DMT family transporter [Butyrivibrio sp. MC2013]|uniref:DMT family transporter n=1 Tax=Butyrivibrio sp. MC2013 TaxID=1280686 RepID=UPI003FA4A0F5
MGTAYAMWTGMGIVGTTLLGIFLFDEKLSVPQVICVILIVVGIIRCVTKSSRKQSACSLPVRANKAYTKSTVL